MYKTFPADAIVWLSQTLIATKYQHTYCGVEKLLKGYCKRIGLTWVLPTGKMELKVRKKEIG